MMDDEKFALDENLLNLLRLNNDDPVASSCIDLISDGHKVRQRSLSQPIPIKHAIDIYSTRETINASRGGNIKGYDRFLPKLNSASASHIMIHNLEFEFDSYDIFTDKATENMFGILYLPKKERGWHKLE